ncbi:enterochelin esterase [Nocardia sp. CS682]|nr:enterochelin esterase [Nocardia sp. CS682]
MSSTSSHELVGQLNEHSIDSKALQDNILQDSSTRPLWVYVPPGYDEDTQRYPSVYLLQGYMGRIEMWRNHYPFQRPFIEVIDERMAAGEIPPAIVVFVDTWTKYGGSQFVDSAGTGRYHSYLCDEIVPWVDSYYRTQPEAAHRGVSGKSSGGFGAMVTAMLRPDLFGGLATHAGDALFEFTCFAKFPMCVRFLRSYGGDIERWWLDFQQRGSFTRPEDPSLLIIYGMSACLSAHPDGTPELPFDPSTGMLRPAVWQRWLDSDPVRMVPQHAEALRSMRAIWVDGGTQDEHYLDIGAQAFHAALEQAGVPDDVVHFELFPGKHNGIDHRYPLSLGWLVERLSGD